MTQKPSVKALALALSFTLGVSPLSFAAAQTAELSNRILPPSTEIEKKLEILKALPREFGSVRETRLVDSESPLVVHIQDAHAHPEAQSNIYEILNFLSQKFPGFSVGLEGATGPLHPEYFDFFPSTPEAAEAVIESLHKKGELSGGERFAWEAYKTEKQEAGNRKQEERNQSSSIFGVETNELYRDNFRMFMNLLEARAEIDSELKRIQSELSIRQSKVLNPELRDFLKERDRRKSGKFANALEGEADLSAYFEYLAQQVKKVAEIDLMHPIEQLRFPHLVRIFHLKEIEKSWDGEKIAEDWTAVLKLMRAHAKTEQEKALVQAFDVFARQNSLLPEMSQDSPSSISSAEGDIYPRRLLERLYLFIQKRNFDLAPYKAFLTSFRFLVFHAEIQLDPFFEEIASLEKTVIDKLARTPEEKQFIRDLENNDLLEKLVHTELTRKEREIIPTRRVEMEKGATGSLLRHFRNALRFYEIAEMRENAFVSNLLEGVETTEQKPEVLVLVTGGFHTEGIAAILEEKGIAHTVIVPRITQPETEGLYHKVMSGANADLTAYFGVRNPFHTKQDALLFKQAIETAVPALSAFGGSSPDNEISRKIQEGIENHPVLSSVVSSHIYGKNVTSFVRFIPQSAAASLNSQSAALSVQSILDGVGNWREGMSLASISPAIRTVEIVGAKSEVRSVSIQESLRQGDLQITRGIIAQKPSPIRSEMRRQKIANVEELVKAVKKAASNLQVAHVNLRIEHGSISSTGWTSSEWITSYQDGSLDAWIETIVQNNRQEFVFPFELIAKPKGSHTLEVILTRSRSEMRHLLERTAENTFSRGYQNYTLTEGASVERVVADFVRRENIARNRVTQIIVDEGEGVEILRDLTNGRILRAGTDVTISFSRSETRDDENIPTSAYVRVEPLFTDPDFKKKISRELDIFRNRLITPESGKPVEAALTALIGGILDKDFFSLSDPDTIIRLEEASSILHVSKDLIRPQVSGLPNLERLFTAINPYFRVSHAGDYPAFSSDSIGLRVETPVFVQKLRSENRIAARESYLSTNIEQAVIRTAKDLNGIYSIPGVQSYSLTGEQALDFVARMILSALGAEVLAQTTTNEELLATLRSALGPYSSFIEPSADPAHLIRRFERTEDFNADRFPALLAVLLAGHDLTVLVPTSNKPELAQAKTAFDDFARKLKVDIAHFYIEGYGEGARLRDAVRTIARKVSSDRKQYWGSLDNLELLQKLGYGPNLSRIFADEAQLDPDTAVVVTASVIRQLFEDPQFDIHELPRVMSRFGLDINDVVQHVAQMIQALKRLASAA